jgi:hypothetical protein
VKPLGDTIRADLVPAGFGSLQREDISLVVRLRGLVVLATPLDESVLRLLAPDSYISLRKLRDDQQDRISTLATRYGVRGFSVWTLSFTAVEPDVPFSPMDVTISNAGREFRPIELLPLTPGFGQHRVEQRATQSALYLFDNAVDISQPLALTVETTRNARWDEILRTIESERTRARTRAARSAPPPP